jgi:hypothetical protein
MARHRAETALRSGTTGAIAGGAVAVLVPAVAVGAATAGEISFPFAFDGFAPLASIVPVTHEPEPEPPEFSIAKLLKAADLAPGSPHCDADLDGLGRVKPWVRDAARFLSCLYDEPDLIGVARRDRHSDHPSGHAVDLMARGARGDRLAACALANQDELGVDYVIWKQRQNEGDGWEPMPDRGGATENHFDHVHVSFERHAPDAGRPDASRCR